jgi:cell division septum initiation protein DivIVA
VPEPAATARIALAEARSARFAREWYGYCRADVDRFLWDLAASLDALLRGYEDLEERHRAAKAALERANRSGRILSDALAAARRVREEAASERQAILARARDEAAALKRAVERELAHTRLELEALRAAERQLRADYEVLLHAALGLVGEASVPNGDRRRAKSARPAFETGGTSVGLPPAGRRLEPESTSPLTIDTA